MKKILLSIECPAISNIFDVYVPASLTVKEAARLLGKGLEEISNHRYISSGNEFLCKKEDRILLKEELMLKDYGIQNGDHIVII